MTNSSDIASLRSRLAEMRDLLDRLDDSLLENIVRAAGIIEESFRAGGKILAFGNGGSAADAAHFTAEFVGRFLCERRGLPAMALASETSAVTAIGNDYGFERVFERQVEALGRPGDVAVGLTTSGKSPNVLLALERARSLGLKTVVFTGAAGLARDVAEIVISVPSGKNYEIQEVHKILLHSVCETVEKGMMKAE